MSPILRIRLRLGEAPYTGPSFEAGIGPGEAASDQRGPAPRRLLVCCWPSSHAFRWLLIAKDELTTGARSGLVNQPLCSMATPPRWPAASC